MRHGGENTEMRPVSPFLSMSDPRSWLADSLLGVSDSTFRRMKK
jgi:hypothetical protein